MFSPSLCKVAIAATVVIYVVDSEKGGYLMMSPTQRTAYEKKGEENPEMVEEKVKL